MPQVRKAMAMSEDVTAQPMDERTEAEYDPNGRRMPMLHEADWPEKPEWPGRDRWRTWD